MAQSAPVNSFVADALSSLPDAPQPTNLAERKVPQNFASLDFQAAYALFSSATSATFVGPPGAVFSAALTTFASFASVFPPQTIKTKAAIAVKVKLLIMAINCCLRH